MDDFGLCNSITYSIIATGIWDKEQLQHNHSYGINDCYASIHDERS